MRPSMAGTTRVCVDRCQDGDLLGTVCSPYIREPIPFAGVAALVRKLEQVADTVGFPQAYEEYRTFSAGAALLRAPANTERSLTRLMDEQEFEIKAGKQATFIIQIRFRQNATWQGTITWSEKKQVQHFRSALEMIRLMDEALGQLQPQEDAQWQ